MANNNGRDSDHEKQSGRTEMIGEEELQTVKQIQAGLNALEQMCSVNTPGRQWFEEQIAQHQKLLRRRFIRDLLLFLSLAFVVLSASLAALARIPAVYFALQAAAVLAVPVIWAANRRKRVKDQ